jgi:hypothetical protein
VDDTHAYTPHAPPDVDLMSGIAYAQKGCVEYEVRAEKEEGGTHVDEAGGRTREVEDLVRGLARHRLALPQRFEDRSERQRLEHGFGHAHVDHTARD